jgi:hypothetical protein
VAFWGNLLIDSEWTVVPLPDEDMLENSDFDSAWNDCCSIELKFPLAPSMVMDL